MTGTEHMKGNEPAMRKVEKMASVGEMAAAIAHDIKNSLAGINAAVQVLAEDFPDDDSRREVAGEILQEIQRLDRSIKDLLSYARLPEPNFVRTSLLPIIERTVRLVAPQGDRQGIEIELRTSEDATEIDVDPDQIQQVFFNVIMRAMQSMSERGGKLTITTSYDRETGMAEVALSDTGPGIPEPELVNLFEPFFSTRRAKTGLGLAISKNIVESHGGTIHVESRKGSGATFRVLLPLERKHG